MIKELYQPTPAALAQKTRMRGPPLPGWIPNQGTQPISYPASIALDYPSIEEHPAYKCRIEPPFKAARHYNASLACHEGRFYVAWRFESFDARSRVAISEIASPSEPVTLRWAALDPNVTCSETQIEDPHLASVGGRLICVISNVVRTFPSICRQRILVIDQEMFHVEHEIPCGLGNPNGIEKNWLPFELPDGSLGVVYKQRPHTIARTSDLEGWVDENAPDLRPKMDGATVSGRTPPAALPTGDYLEFVGGHVKFNATRRGTRYWFGALVFEGKPPFRVLRHTSEPLAWASEASTTLFNPLPGGGHPVALMPAGAAICTSSQGQAVVYVSAGVNDSYNVLFMFDLEALLEGMAPV